MGWNRGLGWKGKTSRKPEIEKLYQEEKAREKASEQKYYTDMGYLDKVNSVLNQCKTMSVNASIAKLKECIEFIPWYYGNVVK